MCVNRRLYSQVLMDETQREVYNKFGEDSSDFDPRQDETKLLAAIIVVYLGWGVLFFTFTAPSSARSCRTWVGICSLILLALEISFVLTEFSLSNAPGFFPRFMTEYECLLCCHSVLPCIVAVLRCISEAIYVDIDKTSITVLQNVVEGQKVRVSCVLIKNLFNFNFLKLLFDHEHSIHAET